MEIEEWREVPGWEGYYEVSNAGRVRSMERIVARSDGRTQRLAARVRKAQVQPDGRASLILCRDSAPRIALVHRLVALAFLGAPREGQEVCHRDGNPLNNHVSNLRWGSHSENMMDRVEHGTHNRGERHNMVKLSEGEVRDIRSLYAGGGLSQAALGKRFGVSQSLVHLIVSRRKWAWLDAEAVV